MESAVALISIGALRNSDNQGGGSPASSHCATAAAVHLTPGAVTLYSSAKGMDTASQVQASGGDACICGPVPGGGDMVRIARDAVHGSDLGTDPQAEKDVENRENLDLVEAFAATAGEGDGTATQDGENAIDNLPKKCSDASTNPRPNPDRRVAGSVSEGDMAAGWVWGSESGGVPGPEENNTVFEAKVQRLENRLAILEALIASLAGGNGHTAPPAHTAATEPAAAQMTFRVFGESYWLPAKHNLTEKGRANLTREFTEWAQYLGPRMLGDIKPLDVNALYQRVNNGSRAPTTIRSMGSHLRELFSYAHENHLCGENPVTQRAWPPVEHGDAARVKRELTFESEEKVCARLVEIGTIGREIKRAGLVYRQVFPTALVIARLIRFVCRCPLRLRAVRGLTWAMLTEDGVLLVPQGLVKTHKDWPFVLTKVCMEYLGPRGKPDALIFEGLPSDSMIWRWIERVAREVGVSDMNATNLRRSFISRMRRVTSSLVISKMASWNEKTIDAHYSCPIPEAEALDWQDKAERAARAPSHRAQTKNPEIES